MIKCKLGLHKYGKPKQWVIDGIVIFQSRCIYCGKIKR